MRIILSIKLNFGEVILMKHVQINNQLHIRITVAQEIIIALLSRRT